MISVTTCPVCGNSSWSKNLSCIDYTVSHETFSITSCTTCNLLATNPRPSNARLGSYYLSSEYISHTNRAHSIIDKIYLVARRFTLRTKEHLLRSHLSKPGNLLDYGCGTGDFLAFCKEKNWNVTGLEPASSPREAAAQKTKAPIHSDIDQIVNISLDAITLWHVLEHVPEPNQLLTKLHHLLKKDGTLFIAVPNHLSYDAQYYKSEWAGYDVPRHLWHFNRDNMKKILHENGLRLLDIVPMKLDSFYVSMLSEKYKHNGKTTIQNLFKAFMNGIRSNYKAKKNGQYSSLIYIAKKHVE